MRSLLVNGLAGSFWAPKRLRAAIYRLSGLTVPWNADIAPQVIVRGKGLAVGGGTAINYRCVFDARAQVTIGKHCGIGIGAQFITSTHDYRDPAVRAGVGAVRPITVGDGTWIGSGATVLSGVRIGDGCVIASGAVVTKDCQSHGLYAGIPARRIRDLHH